MSRKQYEPWDSTFKQLQGYRMEHSHCNVPKKYHDQHLYNWIQDQRRQYKLFIKNNNSSMTEYRVNQLNSIGFNWSVQKQASKKISWNERYNQLAEYKIKHGDCKISKNK